MEKPDHLIKVSGFLIFFNFFSFLIFLLCRMVDPHCDARDSINARIKIAFCSRPKSSDTYHLGIWQLLYHLSILISDSGDPVLVTIAPLN